MTTRDEPILTPSQELARALLAGNPADLGARISAAARTAGTLHMARLVSARAGTRPSAPRPEQSSLSTGAHS